MFSIVSPERRVAPAIDDRTTRHAGDLVSQRKRKNIVEREQ
ncbi:MAG TPA: hypothetical protein VH143_10285 [Kofleriaceae bacterium]|jgi:hypothetical protein|nr:hypothetical protein [Kofleriaceae bacterium]